MSAILTDAEPSLRSIDEARDPAGSLADARRGRTAPNASTRSANVLVGRALAAGASKGSGSLERLAGVPGPLP